MKRNSSVILALSAMFLLAACGGQPASSSQSASTATSVQTSATTKATSVQTSATTEATSVQTSATTQATSAQVDPGTDPEVDPYADSPMKISVLLGETVITNGLPVNPSKETEYQMIGAKFETVELMSQIKFVFTPAEGDPVDYDFSKVKADCLALVEEGENGYFKIKEAGTYNFYIETGDYQPGIWVEKAKEIDPTAVTTMNLYVKFNIEDANLGSVYAWVWSEGGEGAWHYATYVAEDWEALNNHHYTVGVVDPVGKKVKVAVFSAESGVDADHAPDAEWTGKIAESAEATFADWGADIYGA